MSIGRYLFKTREEAEAALEKANFHWMDQIYDGGYIPEGKIIGVKIIDKMFEEDQSEKPEFYGVIDEYWEYMVDKETNQWKIVI